MTARAASFESPDTGPGVAWAFEFDENGRGHPLSGDVPIDLVHGRRFVWLHLMLANARSRDWISEQNSILPEARELILSADGHPRFEWQGDALWGALYDIQRELGAQGEESTDVRFVLTPHYLVTARRHPVMSADAVKKEIESGVIFDGSAELFERMLVATADTVAEASRRIANELDRIEDRVLADALSDESASLLKLRRALSRQDRLIHAVQSVLMQLEQRRAEGASQTYRDLANRVGQRVASFHADLRLQGERARMLQEEMAAQLASATNRNLFILTLVTTVLLPPAFVTGFFGMNTKNLFFSESENGTLYATALCALAAVLVYLLIRRYRMLN